MSSYLDLEALRSRAPAVFTAEPAPQMSSRYGFINTANVVQAFAEQGYLPVDAKQDHAQKRDPRYVRHTVVLRHEDIINRAAEVGAEVPQILLLNSHNGRTMLRMRAGLYRFVCANGLVVGDDSFTAEFRHQQSAASIAASFAETMAEGMSELWARVERWKGIELTRQQQYDFARAAAKLRFGASAEAYQLDDILEATRTEDEGGTLWQVFNTTQEKLMKGGLSGKNANGRKVSSRPVKGITNDIDFNDELWRIAADLAA